MFSRRSSLAALLFASLVSATALAADQKRIGANDCLFGYDDPGYSGHDSWDRGNMRFGTQNPWPEYIPMVVMCPLVRSNTTNTNGLTALKLNLYKYWGSTFTCYAQSADQNGSVLKRVAKSTTQTGLISLDWSNLLNTSSAKGTYGVSCDVIGALESNQWGDELESIEYTEP